ncbi:MAG TPA: chemotaxis protein CheW [Tepidisphaeraceae bacterium]|nr:chemotaxis protein CheW [Tepidisphaeraceae bacterium]
MIAPDAARVQQILKARARDLARPAAGNARADKTVDVIEFLLATERYAIEHSFVREVHPLRDLTPLPCTPSFVRGIVNVRGRIVAVLDFRRFFGLPEAGIADVHSVIILHAEGIELGLEADAIAQVRAIPASRIHPPLETITGVGAHFLHGITDDHVAVLDAAKILADPRLIVDADASQGDQS